MDSNAITSAVQSLQYELSSLRNMLSDEICRRRDAEYMKENNPPYTPPKASSSRFEAMQTVASTILAKHQDDISSLSLLQVRDVLTLFLMGSISRYGVAQCLTQPCSGHPVDNLTLVEIIEEADKYLPGYKEELQNAR